MHCTDARGGLLGSTIVCARFARSRFPRGKGGISDAAFGVVFPLAGGRCVPRTGVRLDCPLGVSSPASLPCLSLLLHSGATWFSSRTGALDWEETVENAAAAWTVPNDAETRSLKVDTGCISVWAPACQDSIPGGHAGVGVVSLKGAPLTVPSFYTPELGEFFMLGRAIRVILPLANGIIAHLFVVYGYQGCSSDSHKLFLTKKLFEAVIGEAKVCGSGQPVIIAGDFNAEPSVIPVTAKALHYGDLVDLEKVFSNGRGQDPSQNL